MELPKINVFGPLKFNSRLPSNQNLLLNSLQTDNIFIKKKLAEFEVRLDNYTQSINLKMIDFYLNII